MHKVHSMVLMLLLAPLVPVQAAGADVRVIVSGEVSPGVYGRVEIGSAPPPPVVYSKPVIVIQQPPSVRVQPVYLHVPPGHAKNWSKHCRKYNACGVPVYFVMSKEYEPKKPGKGKRGRD